jgi:hypothetical protein
MLEGVNSNMIQYKNFHKCHNVPPPSTIIFKRVKIYFKKEQRKKRKTNIIGNKGDNFIFSVSVFALIF